MSFLHRVTRLPRARDVRVHTRRAAGMRIPVHGHTNSHRNFSSMSDWRLAVLRALVGARLHGRRLLSQGSRLHRVGLRGYARARAWCVCACVCVCGSRVYVIGTSSRTLRALFLLLPFDRPTDRPSDRRGVRSRFTIVLHRDVGDCPARLTVPRAPYHRDRSAPSTAETEKTVPFARRIALNVT